MTAQADLKKLLVEAGKQGTKPAWVWIADVGPEGKQQRWLTESHFALNLASDGGSEPSRLSNAARDLFATYNLELEPGAYRVDTKSIATVDATVPNLEMVLPAGELPTLEPVELMGHAALCLNGDGKTLYRIMATADGVNVAFRHDYCRVIESAHTVTRWAQVSARKPAAAYTADGRMVGVVMPYLLK